MRCAWRSFTATRRPALFFIPITPSPALSRGTAGWPVPEGLPCLIPRLNDPAGGGYRPPCPFALRRGDGHGYDGHRDRGGCCRGGACGRLHGVDDRPIREVDQSV